MKKILHRISLLLVIFPLLLQAQLETRLFIAPGYMLEKHINHTVILDNKKQILELYNPEKTMFAWDWDETLVEWHYKTLIDTVAKHPLLFSQYNLGYWVSLIPGNYFELGNAFKGKNQSSIEDVYYYLNDKKIYPKLSAFLLMLGSMSMPKPIIPIIIKQLKEKGYEQAIATNKHLVLFAYAQKKPGIASFINNFQKILVFNPRSDITSNAIASSAVQKPNTAYYQRFDEIFNKEGKIVIFIDDKKSNFAPIANGELPNWIGIHFVDEKTLIEDLTTLGIISSLAKEPRKQ